LISAACGLTALANSSAYAAGDPPALRHLAKRGRVDGRVASP
jgi:hypothetical protein